MFSHNKDVLSESGRFTWIVGYKKYGTAGENRRRQFLHVCTGYRIKRREGLIQKYDVNAEEVKIKVYRKGLMS